MKIRELLTDESKWCKKSYAFDAQGRKTTGYSPNAVKFCLVGAAQHCYGTGYIEYVIKMQDALKRKFDVGVIALWQDQPERTFAEVKALVEELDI